MAEPPIVATYRIATDTAVERAAEAMAGESSGGRCRATVRAIRPVEPAAGAHLASRTGARPQRWAEIDVALPPELVGTDLFTLLAAVLGNVYERPELAAVRLVALDLPQWFTAAHPGPRFGVAGTRGLVGGVAGRPLIGSIIKPSVGLTPQQTADMVLELALAGIDFVKDDELMTSPPDSPLTERVAAVMAAVRDAADVTGRQVMFAFNVSADDVGTLLANHDTVVAAGGTAVMVSVNQVGFSAFTRLRAVCEVPIHVHRNGWGVLTRSPALGLDFAPYQALWRLAGGDQIHVNGIRNKFYEPDESVVRSIAACLRPIPPHGPILPVVSSGQWGGQAPDTYAATRTVDLLYLAGGGIQGHPGGPAAGVRAIRAAWRAAVAGRSLEEAARDHPELAQAVERFSR